MSMLSIIVKSKTAFNDVQVNKILGKYRTVGLIPASQVVVTSEVRWHIFLWFLPISLLSRSEEWGHFRDSQQPL